MIIVTYSDHFTGLILLFETNYFLRSYMRIMSLERIMSEAEAVFLCKKSGI